MQIGTRADTIGNNDIISWEHCYKNCDIQIIAIEYMCTSTFNNVHVHVDIYIMSEECKIFNT